MTTLEIIVAVYAISFVAGLALKAAGAA